MDEGEIEVAPVQEETQEAAHEAAEAENLGSIRAEIAGLIERLKAIEDRLSAAEMTELMEAIHELHSEDVAPRSGSWLYRSIGRRED